MGPTQGFLTSASSDFSHIKQGNYLVRSGLAPVANVFFVQAIGVSGGEQNMEQQLKCT
jgi:hypothetical protein